LWLLALVSRRMDMDKKLAGLLGAAAALTTMTGANATAPATTLHATSYAELLNPVPNAVAQLIADDEARATGSRSARWMWPKFGSRWITIITIIIAIVADTGVTTITTIITATTWPSRGRTSNALALTEQCGSGSCPGRTVYLAGIDRAHSGRQLSFCLGLGGSQNMPISTVKNCVR